MKAIKSAVLVYKRPLDLLQRLETLFQLFSCINEGKAPIIEVINLPTSFSRRCVIFKKELSVTLADIPWTKQ